MPKVKIQAGAELDVISASEMREALGAVQQSWFAELTRGDRYRTFSAKGTIAGGALTIGGAADVTNPALGPAEGFVWDVRRLGAHGLTTVTGTPAVATSEPLSVYVNASDPSTLVNPKFAGYHSLNSGELVLRPGDELMFVGASLTSTGVITITGQVRELPVGLTWRIGS